MTIIVDEHGFGVNDVRHFESRRRSDGTKEIYIETMKEFPMPEILAMRAAGFTCNVDWVSVPYKKVVLIVL